MFDFSGGRAKRLLSLQAPEAVTCAAPHIADTAFLLSGAANGAIHVWQVNNGSLITSLCDAASLGSAASSICWEGCCQDVSRLYAGSDTGSIKLWDLDQGQVAGTLKGHKAAPTCLSHCLHTGTLASGSQDTTVKLWDPRTKEAAATLKGQGAAITQVKLSPDGSLLVSGSEEGAIKVWDMRSARLLHDLKQHTKRVHSLAFHPEEQLLVSSSADRTVRFWDLCTHEQCDKAGPVAKEVRIVAFPSDGRTLLAASADGLRTYSWEPCHSHDMVDVPWAKVSELCYFDGKAFGLAFVHSTVDMWTVDLTQVRPLGEPRRPASSPDSRRMSFQEPLVQGAPVSRSMERLARQPGLRSTTLQHRPPLPQGPGPAARFVAERRHQLNTAAPRQSASSAVAGGVEVLAAPGLRSVPAQRNSPTRAPAANSYSQLEDLHPCASSSSTCSAGSDCSTPCAAEGQHSTAENGLFSDPASQKSTGAAACENRRATGPDSSCLGAQLTAGLVYVTDTTHWQLNSQQDSGMGLEDWGPEVADSILLQHANVRATLRTRASQLREVRDLLGRGDVRSVLHAIKAYQDLAITMHAVAKWATLPNPPLDVCIEAATLCNSLLSSAESVNQDVGLQMAGCVVQRWGSFITGALSTQFARQGVDVEYESRRERCSRCKEQLQCLLPALSKLTSAGNSKAAQLASAITDL